MRPATYLALFAGLTLFLALLFWFGAQEILAGAAAAGWGLLCVAAFRCVTIPAHACGWRALYPAAERPAFIPLCCMRWIGESVNALLPVGQVGGELVRARMARRLGSSGAQSGAIVMVDFTLGLVTELVYVILGAALLLPVIGPGRPARGLLVGLALAAAAIAGFFFFQQFQPFGKTLWLAGGVFRRTAGEAFAGGAAALDAALGGVYARRGPLVAGFTWRLAAWLLQTGETWIALYFLGAPVDPGRALVVESLSSAVRSAAFAVPGALGVQEGGILLVGSLVGLRPEVALSLALVKRVREILVGVPGLVAWTWMEGQSLAKLLSKKDVPG